MYIIYIYIYNYKVYTVDAVEEKLKILPVRPLCSSPQVH